MKLKRSVPLKDLPDLTGYLTPSEIEKALVRVKEHEWWEAHPEYHWVIRELERWYDQRSADLLDYYKYYGYLTRAQTTAVRRDYAYQ
jgi:hypothetical protein